MGQARRFVGADGSGTGRGLGAGAPRRALLSLRSAEPVLSSAFFLHVGEACLPAAGPASSLLGQWPQCGR